MFSIILAQAPAAGEPHTLSQLEDVFANVVRVAIPFAGIVLFVILLLAGVSWISAGADAGKAAQARNMATYAILGVVALACAYLVITFIAGFTGVNQIKNFVIYQ